MQRVNYGIENCLLLAENISTNQPLWEIQENNYKMEDTRDRYIKDNTEELLDDNIEALSGC